MTKARNIADLGSNDVIETTATGVDVTGTVTAGGLTVQTAQGDINVNSSASDLEFTRAGTNYIRATDSAGEFRFVTGADDFSTVRLNVSSGGDVSFYEDTGTTAKMVWDASAESLSVPDLQLSLSDTNSTGTIGRTDRVYIEMKREDFDGSINFYTTTNGSSGVANRMTISDTGNVGIGTASPDTKFEVNGGNINTVASFKSSDADCRIAIADNTTTEWYSNSIGAIGNNLTLQSNGTERARIDSSGNLLVGTTSATGKFEVYDASNKTEGFPHVRITGAGYSGYHFLDGTAYYIGQNSGARNLRLYSGAETSGVNLSPSGTSWGSFSDERLKENIEPIENALDTISNLRTVKYHLKDVDSNDDKKKIGVIAQDLVGVLDEVIDTVRRTDDDTDYMSVRYTEIIPVLIKGIQEQQETISELKARIEELEK